MLTSPFSGEGRAVSCGLYRLGLTGFIVLCVVGPLGKGGWRTKFFEKSETEEDESKQKSN